MALQTRTNEQCSEWLSSKRILEDPYHHQDQRSDFTYDQLLLPAATGNATAMLRKLVLTAEPFDSALLYVTDWSTYSLDEMLTVCQIRQYHGDDGWLIKTPGHVFGSDERDLLIEMMGLVVEYGWTAYVCFNHRLTLMRWEGELMDVWSPDWMHEISDLVDELQSEAERFRSKEG